MYGVVNAGVNVDVDLQVMRGGKRSKGKNYIYMKRKERRKRWERVGESEG